MRPLTVIIIGKCMEHTIGYIPLSNDVGSASLSLSLVYCIETFRVKNGFIWFLLFLWHGMY